MKIEEVSVFQFAVWSFERDRDVAEEFLETATFDDLSEEERKAYMEEAEYYIKEHPKDDWPVDILERLEGISGLN